MSNLEKSTNSDGYELTQLGPKPRQIPVQWDVRKLGTIANVNMGSSPKSEYYNEEGDGLPFFQGNADFGVQHPQVTVWCTNPNKTADEGDLLLSVRAPVGDLNIADQHCCIGRGLAAISGEEADDSFLYYLLSFERPRLETYAQGSTFQSVNSGVLNNFPVQFPLLPEQRAIADILSTVDKQIQQTDEIIEKRKELRQGLLQELFHRGTGEHERILAPEELADKAGGVNTGMDQTTVGQIPEGWGTERLGELTENSAYGVNASAEAFDPDKPRYLRITDIADDGHLKQDDPKSISRDVSEGYELKPGDLVFARTGATVGKTLLYQESHPEATYAGYLIRFQLDQTRILPKFAFYFTQTGNYDRWVSRITRQGAQENINTGEYCSILLPLPPISEQQEIVSIIDTVDQKIEQERKTKESLQDLKRGLMQDLLTGKVRVNTD